MLKLCFFTERTFNAVPQRILFPFRIAIVSQFFYQICHITWQLGIELHKFSRCRMNKAQRLCVQRLTRTHGEAIFHELLVLSERRATNYLVSAIRFVIKQRQSDRLEMTSYLMRTPRFQIALHNRHVS